MSFMIDSTFPGATPKMPIAAEQVQPSHNPGALDHPKTSGSSMGHMININTVRVQDGIT